MRRWIALFLCLLCVPALAQSTSTFAFRRMSEPVQAAVGPTAQATMVPPNLMLDPVSKQRLGSFYIANPNMVWIRLKGFSNQDDCNNIGVTPTTGWLWPPGHVAVYSTQYPVCISVMAVPKPGFPLTGDYAPAELSYGPGQ
jgi:hypothetical protein